MATVYFLCGLPTSGKTSFAKKLEMEKHAVRFTLDERMMAKYDFSIFDEQYGRLASREKQLIWEEAKATLNKDGNVVLDWSLWSRESRAEWPLKVIGEGYDYKLIYLEAPLEILRRRLHIRNSEAGSLTHFIPLEELERFSKIFEPPTSEENLNLEVISVPG